MIYDNEDEVIEELFQSILSRYQLGLGYQREAVISTLIEFTYCIINAIK